MFGRYGVPDLFLDFILCFVCLLLLLSGDIQVNPRPFQYPCGVCKQSVKQNQRALLCDGCDNWFHICCATEVYKTYSSQNSFPWHCPMCLFSVLPSCDTLSCNDSLGSAADESLFEQFANLKSLTYGVVIYCWRSSSII